MSKSLKVHPDYEFMRSDLLNLIRNFHAEGELIVAGSRNIIKAQTIGGVKCSI